MYCAGGSRDVTSTNMPAAAVEPVQVSLAQSGMNAPRTAAARAGYLPIPLDQVLVRALAGMPVYLATGNEGANRFTLYCAQNARFTEFHKRRLQEAAVRFIYLPIDCHARFRRQVEKELITIVTDPAVAAGSRAALVYQTSLELIDDLLAEQDLGKNMPRVQHVARAVSTMVINQPKAFSHLYATAQHDFYTATHMVNVGTWITSLALAMGITDPAELESACTGGMVHDVGKMFVPEEILNKTERLSDEEWAVLRSHSARGHEHLRSQGVSSDIVLRITLEHHERMDGTGYPSGLKGDQMHPLSRICAVVDSFDAMTACRPFKNRVKTIAEALAILQSEAPAKYDPKVVEAWAGLLKKASQDGAFRESIDPAAASVGRRRHTRHCIDCPAQLRLLTGSPGGAWTEGPPQAAKAHNISREGVGLLAKQPLSIGQYVRAVLKGKGTLQDRTLEGQIVRARAHSDGWHELGVRFCKPGEQEKSAAQLIQ